MKIFRKMTVLLFFFGLLSACGNSLISTPSNNNVTLIQIKNNTSIDIYGIELSFQQNGNKISTHNVMHGNGSKFKQGEVVSFEVIEGDFDLLELVTIEASILTVKNSYKKILIGSVDAVQISKGQTNNFEIIGDRSSGLIFRKKVD